MQTAGPAVLCLASPRADAPLQTIQPDAAIDLRLKVATIAPRRELPVKPCWAEKKASQHGCDADQFTGEIRACALTQAAFFDGFESVFAQFAVQG